MVWFQGRREGVRPVGIENRGSSLFPEPARCQEVFPIWKVCPSFLLAVCRGLAPVGEQTGPPSSPGHATSSQASAHHSDQARQGSIWPEGPRCKHGPGKTNHWTFFSSLEFQRSPVIPSALMSGSCRSQGPLQGNPQFSKNEMCNKACSLPTFQQPRRCSTISVLQRPHVAYRAVPVSPRLVHHLFSGTLPMPEFTWCRLCKVSGAGTSSSILSFLIKIHPLFTTCPPVLSSHCLMSTQA